MKKAIVVLSLLLFSSIAAHAQTGGMMGGHHGEKGQSMMMHEGQEMPMMPMCASMMEHMKGHGMMMQDMMQMMTDMVKMQQKIVEGVKPAEKKAMMNELSGMTARMEKMMSDMKGMMSQGMMGGTASAETKKEEQTGGPQKTLEKTEAGVTVKIALESADGTVKFRIALETHTVELDKYKFDEIVALRAGGKEYKGSVVSQEGSGHHRSAVVEFDKPGAKEFDVVVKDVAGVKERVFKF